MSKTKNIIIGGLLVAIVAMSIGYAALAQELTINGTATIDAEWDIHFNSITLDTDESVGVTENATPSASGTSATFNVELAYPGAVAHYDIVVENGGSIDATLSSISGVDTANNTEPTEIKYTVTNIAAGDDLTAGQSTTFRVTVEWLDSDTIPTTTSKTATITLNYAQKA